jgi:hypothetical protein
MKPSYQVVLSAEDGEYIKETFNTYIAACQYCEDNAERYGEDQELYVKPVY